MNSKYFNTLSPTEADTKWQSDAEWVFCTIGIDVTTIIEEVLQAWLQVDAKVRRKVILQAKAECCGELAGNIEAFFLLEGATAIVDMIDIRDATYGQFQHDSC